MFSYVITCICYFYWQEVDSALLSIIGFPAFAVDDQQLINLTKETILTKCMVSGNLQLTCSYGNHITTVTKYPAQLCQLIIACHLGNAVN